ncbi:unnamed protein product [Ixodes pacificus]
MVASVLKLYQKSQKNAFLSVRLSFLTPPFQAEEVTFLNPNHRQSRQLCTTHQNGAAYEIFEKWSAGTRSVAYVVALDKKVRHKSLSNLFYINVYESETFYIRTVIAIP